MTEQRDLATIRDQRFFIAWDGNVTAERIEASEGNIRMLIDELLAPGPALSEDEARAAVDKCVDRFNELDDGWICTIEREDIYEQVGQIIDTCGFEFDEDWLDERDW